MSRVFVIAEAACTWLHGGLEAAYRSIRAAKDCDADAWKSQWTSDYAAMHARRGVVGDHYKRLAWPREWLPLLKAECDRVGVEFMCTVFIPQDIPTVAEYVDRFKVSAFESGDVKFVKAHEKYEQPVVISRNNGLGFNSSDLYCVSEYPTPLGHLKLSKAFEAIDDTICGPQVQFGGLSDHTTSVLTGAVAVGAGARILEKHVRLVDTPKDDPDYGHSLLLDCGSRDAQGDWGCEGCQKGFHRYVESVREAEAML